ncbi:MAG TPA: hypothetical protein VFD53_07005, partial [Ilumatobacter sp.]|nr:hypothetical protein [Ilumatobacter sp.]
MSSQHNTAANSALFIGRKSRGTGASPSAIVNGDFLTGFLPEAYDGNSYEQTGFLGFVSNGTVADGSVPTDFVLSTGSTAQGSERLRVTSAGDVGIGMTNPQARLFVARDGSLFGTDSTAAITVANASNTNRRLDIGYDTTPDAGYLQARQVGSGNRNLLLNPAGGNVGIGDSSPASTLTVGDGDLFQVAGASGNITTSGDLALNGGDLTSSSATFNLAASATTLNLAGGSGSTGCTVDGSGNLACTGSISGTGDSLDYDDFEDTMDLDTALILNQGTNSWTQNFTGTGAGYVYNANSVTGSNAFTINANALTDGSALQISSTTGAQSVGGAIFEINQAGTFVATTAVGGNTMAIRRQPTLSGAGTTLTIDQALLDIIDVASVSGGATLAHSGSVARFIQNSSGATGDVVLVSSSGSGDALQINQNAAGANAIDIAATALTTGNVLNISAGNFTDDSGRVIFIDTTETTDTADIMLVQTDFGSSNNNVFKIEADGEVFSDVGFTAGAFSTKFYDGSIESTGTLSVNTTSNSAVTLGGGNLTVDTNTLFVDAANNRVGIGTAAPGQLLELVGGENSSIDLKTGAMTLRSSVNTVAGAQFGTVSSHKLTLFTGNTERMVLDASGNVGIGASTPITQLHVPGKIPAATLGSVATGSTPTAVYVQGRYAYVVNQGAETLQIFDVSNPASMLS